MGGGGKGSRQTSTVELPQELEQGSVGALGGALQSASLPYRANRGVTIAGFSPQQQAAFQGADSAASAFGLPTGGAGQYLPQAQTTAGGFQGYSTGGLFDEQVNASMSRNDQLQRDAILRNYGMIGNEILRGDTLGNVPLNRVNSSGGKGGGSFSGQGR